MLLSKLWLATAYFKIFYSDPYKLPSLPFTLFRNTGMCREISRENFIEMKWAAGRLTNGMKFCNAMKALTDPLTHLALKATSLTHWLHLHWWSPAHLYICTSCPMNPCALRLMVWFTLLHSDPYTHTCTQNRNAQERVNKEFNKKVEQTALIRHGAPADKQQY